MEPIAPVASAAAMRQSALGQSGLSVGQILQARVVVVTGDRARLQWGDQSVSVSSRVPLSVGQQVSLLVEQGASGKMLLRMVDDTFGKSRPGRNDGTATSGSRGTGAPAPTAGSRQGPVTAVPGRTTPNGQSATGGDSGLSGANGGTVIGGRLILEGPPPTRTGGAPIAPPGSRGTTTPQAGAGAGGAVGNGGQVVGSPWLPTAPGQPGMAASASALAALLFEPLDGTPARLAGGAPPATPAGAAGHTTVRAANTAATAPQSGAPRAGPGAPAESAAGFIARAALPTYGRLAQSVGGAVAFGQLLAMHGSEIGQTLARASLAPASLGRLLIDLGVHPDEMNAVLVGELLAQGETVQESGIRNLRRELAAAGGSLRDAAPAVTLSRLGLPITPLSLAVARQLQSGQLNPSAAWGELLADLQQLMRGNSAGSQAGILAAELLAEWRVPLEEGANGIGRWLRTAVDQAGTPLEAKLARPLPTDGSTNPAHTSPSQDARARLDLMAQALSLAGRGSGGSERGMLAASLQRVQATVQAEQLLNGSTSTGARTEPRFFAVTLPTVMGQHFSTLELRVREREARPARAGEPPRPDIVQLKLSLPGLGDVGVNLTIGQHSVGCHFAATSAFAEALLNASSGELAGRLKRLGYGHTTIEAAVEPAEVIAPAHSPTPRLHQVDATA